MNLKEKLEAKKKGKKGGFLLGIVVIGGYFAWQGYNSYNRVRLNRFVDSYNVYIAAQNRLAESFESMVNQGMEWGSKLPETVMMTMSSNVKSLATGEKHGCGVLPDTALRSECQEVFSAYYQTLSEVKENGVTAESVAALEKHMVSSAAIQAKVLEKYPRYVKQGNNSL